MELAFTTSHGALYAEDCLEVLEGIKSDSIDCVFTDPPFNVGKDYNNGYNDNMPKEEYFKWSRKWINECARVLKPGGAFFLYALPELNI